MKKNVQIKFGKRVRQKRLEMGFSQEKLAYKAGITSNYVGRIERGQVNPSLETMYKLSLALEVSLSWLVEKI